VRDKTRRKERGRKEKSEKMKGIKSESPILNEF
jgi:hypothetical protein